MREKYDLRTRFVKPSDYQVNSILEIKYQFLQRFFFNGVFMLRLIKQLGGYSMKNLVKKFVKGTIATSVLASGLLIGTASFETSELVGTQTVQAASKKVSKKGVFTLSKGFTLKEAQNELRPEAARLIRIYGESNRTGKTTTFNKYAKNHIAPKTDTNYLLGYKYSTDRYKERIKLNRKSNSKKIIHLYGKNLKLATTSKVKNYDSRKGTGWANIRYQFQPKDFNAMGNVSVTLKFTKVKSGKYVLEDIHFY